ncbi:hypothetical protein FXO38_32544 [Capsicum annuum]|nr:hypothetical protein FXO38_32544 [Capsicum annuum]
MAAVAVKKPDAAPSSLPGFPLLLPIRRKPDAAETAGISAGRELAPSPNINHANTAASSPVEDLLNDERSSQEYSQEDESDDDFDNINESDSNLDNVDESDSDLDEVEWWKSLSVPPEIFRSSPYYSSAPVPKFRQDTRDRAPGSMSQGNMNNTHTNPICKRCGRNHKGEFMAGSNSYFGFVNLGHRVRDFPVVVQKGKANIVADTLSRLSMGSITHVEDDKKELVREVH